MLLDELIVRYEEGMKLVKTCQERLASAEQRIEIITRNHEGKPVVEPFEPATDAVRGPAVPEKEESKHGIRKQQVLSPGNPTSPPHPPTFRARIP